MVVSGKMGKSEVVFGQSGCIRAKVVVFGRGQSGCIRAKVVVSGKVVIIGQSVVVLFGQKAKWLYAVKVLYYWLYSGKSGCIFGQKLVVFGY